MQKIDSHLLTRESYDRLVERGAFIAGDRVELIEGVIVEMTPQSAAHTTAIGLVNEALRRVLEGRYLVRIQSPLVLGASSEPEPDVAVVQGRLRDYRSVHPASAILVVEVADSSLVYDRVWKGSLYARAGIHDYWIINLIGQRVEVYRNPRPADSAQFGWEYGEHSTVGRGEYLSAEIFGSARIPVEELLP